MTSNSFIQALRRLIARRVNVRQIRSDNEPNFVGVEEELINALNQVEHTKIQEFLQNHYAYWIKWTRNPPAASYMSMAVEYRSEYGSVKFAQPKVYYNIV